MKKLFGSAKHSVWSDWIFHPIFLYLVDIYVCVCGSQYPDVSGGPWRHLILTCTLVDIPYTKTAKLLANSFDETLPGYIKTPAHVRKPTITLVTVTFVLSLYKFPVVVRFERLARSMVSPRDSRMGRDFLPGWSRKPVPDRRRIPRHVSTSPHAAVFHAGRGLIVWTGRRGRRLHVVRGFVFSRNEHALHQERVQAPASTNGQSMLNALNTLRGIHV